MPNPVLALALKQSFTDSKSSRVLFISMLSPHTMFMRRFLAAGEFPESRGHFFKSITASSAAVSPKPQPYAKNEFSPCSGKIFFSVGKSVFIIPFPEIMSNIEQTAFATHLFASPNASFSVLFRLDIIMSFGRDTAILLRLCKYLNAFWARDTRSLPSISSGRMQKFTMNFIELSEER